MDALWVKDSFRWRIYLPPRTPSSPNTPSGKGPPPISEDNFQVKDPFTSKDPFNWMTLSTPFYYQGLPSGEESLHFQGPLSDEGPLHLQIAIFKRWTPSHWLSVHNPQVCFNVTSKTIQSESIRFRCTNHKLTSSKWTRLSDTLADVMMIFTSRLNLPYFWRWYHRDIFDLLFSNVNFFFTLEVSRQSSYVFFF